jgi:hypothetical protein
MHALLGGKLRDVVPMIAYLFLAIQSTPRRRRHPIDQLLVLDQGNNARRRLAGLKQTTYDAHDMSCQVPAYAQVALAALAVLSGGVAHGRDAPTTCFIGNSLTEHTSLPSIRPGSTTWVAA